MLAHDPCIVAVPDGAEIRCVRARRDSARASATGVSGSNQSSVGIGEENITASGEAGGPTAVEAARRPAGSTRPLVPGSPAGASLLGLWCWRWRRWRLAASAVHAFWLVL